LQLKNKSKKAKDTNKITTNKKKVKRAKKIKIKTKKTKIETKITKTNTKVDIRANTTIAIATTITINKKRLLRLYKQFVYIYISFVFKIALILLNCLLLFNNL